MRFHIPFTISNLEKLKRQSAIFIIKTKKKKNQKLQQYLENSDSGISIEEYNSIKTRSFLISFMVLYVIFSTFLILLKIQRALLLSFGLTIIFSIFIFFSQSIYPKVFENRRVREIEKNLIPALEDMLVQLNSGIPLFNIIVNISSSDYGELSEEFKKAAKKINAGFPQMEVLEKMGEKNSSMYFKRTLWQLSNGMKAGSDISLVIRESIKTLNEEQLLQIQNYGNKLNPLIMFYLLISVILPALSITFLTILTAMLGLQKTLSILMYLGLFVFVILIQIMFLGMIKSIRPSLL